MATVEPSRIASAASVSATLSQAGFSALQKFIYAESGIALGPEKQYLFDARLTPILKQEQIASLDALAILLVGKTSSSKLRRLVVEAITTHETLFFRDPIMFEALRKEVLPGLFGTRNGARKLRIWSAAASSGQEAYSLAMLALDLGRDASDTEILGTDLSTQVLERAREGLYSAFDLGRGVSPSLLWKHFDKKGSEWQIKDHVRRMVRFEQRDLRGDMTALGKFDLILCRNVLIYFDSATKKSICATLQSVLNPGAFLSLGAGEILPSGVNLRRVAIGGSSFYCPAAS